MADIFALEETIPESLANLQLADPTLLREYKLAELRIFYIDYEIEENILELQKDILLINLHDSANCISVEERKPIIIFINTVGGLLSETMSLVATIQMSVTPIYTINLGEAYSAGAMILLSGHKRFAMPYSKALVHTGSGGLSGTHEQVMAQSKLYEKQVKIMGDFICAHSKIDQKLYSKNKSKEWYLDTDEQLRYGLVDKIIDNIFDII